MERLAELPDPRGRHGRQYPLVGVLTLCLVAVMGGHTTPEAISQFGRLRQKRLGHALGPVAAPADVLLRYTRAHWGIETLHHVRDVTLGEGRCRVRRCTAGVASLRNAAV